MKPKKPYCDLLEKHKSYLIEMNWEICKQGTQLIRVANFLLYTHLWTRMDLSGWAEDFKLQF